VGAIVCLCRPLPVRLGGAAGYLPDDLVSAIVCQCQPLPARHGGAPGGVGASVCSPPMPQTAVPVALTAIPLMRPCLELLLGLMLLQMLPWQLE
jgi:hypothetical protein